MGKTTKPLIILVDDDLATSQQILDLQEQGHTIECDDLSKYDLILSPKAWRCTPELVSNIKYAVKGARGLVYDKSKGESRLKQSNKTNNETREKLLQPGTKVSSTTAGSKLSKGRTKPSKKVTRKRNKQEQLALDYPSFKIGDQQYS